MKILGGQARGRTLRQAPKSPHLRPILARIKKSVFDILRPRMRGSRFLDLYAGTGSVGLEAISEGAASAVFVEEDRGCSKLIEENVALLKFQSSARVFRLSVQGNLGVLPGPFDLIFMGPPYKDKNLVEHALVMPTLDSIARHKLLAPGGLIVAQHHKKEQPASNADWEMVRQEKYGDTLVSFFRASH